MADERNGGGGFGWFILGGLVDWAGVGHAANFRIDAWVTPPAYTARPPLILPGLRGSETVQRAREAAQRARTMVTDPDHPVGKAIQDGVAAAKRKREELEATAARKMQRATNLEE